jgi:hypothetical protein
MQRISNAAILAAFCATLATMATAPAWAQQAADVTVQHLAYRLVDLAPDDGIAPALTWTGDATLAYSHVYDQEGNEIDGVQIEAPGTSGYDNAYASARVEAQADSAHIGFNLASGYGFASSNRSFHFTLSPHTQVIFSADAALWASPTPEPHSTLTALAELYGSLHVDDDGDWSFNDRAQVDAGSRQATLSVSSTSQDAWVDGYLAYSAYAVAESHALPVPEPAPGAMLAGGMGMLALIARRRKI